MDQPSKERDNSHQSARFVSPALHGIFILLLFYTLYFAASFFLPIYIAFLLSLALSPIVRVLQRLRIPRPLGAALLLISLLAVGGYAISALSGPAAEWMAKAPKSFTQIERRLRSVKKPFEQMTKATESVEDMADVDGEETPQVEIRQPSLAETLFVSTQALVGNAFVILVLLYFLLVSAEDLVRKLATVLPHSYGQPGAAEVARQVESEISRYLLTVCIINGGVAAVVATTMYFLAMPSPLLWGAVAGTLNFIPFIGAMVTTAILTIVSLLTFDHLAQAVVPPLVFVGITSFEGFFVTPSFVGRRLMLSPIAILLALLVWSWIWGVAGALIAVPTLAILKIICDRSERLSPIALLISP